MKITAEELAKETKGTILFGDPSLSFEHITTSSKQLKGNDLFVPIVGERTDGHLYIASAFQQGASVSLTEKDEIPEEVLAYKDSKALVKIEHSVPALQELAFSYRRNHISIPYVGITGSVGKTSTREMVAVALSSAYKVYATKGNANSQIGLPITVLETDPEAGIGVLELGISEFGEMQKISRIADVDIALITNIGISHIAQFGTQENILKEKLNILSGDRSEAILLVNGDDELLKDLTEEKIHACGIREDKKITVLRFGLGAKNDYRAENVRVTRGPADFEFVKRHSYDRINVSLSVYGNHMMINALAAMAVSDVLGIDLNRAAAALGQFEGFEGRGKVMVKDGVTIINDCYNASPASMKAGLKVLEQMAAKGRKIAVLADMKELGPQEKVYHRQIGDFINEELEDLDILVAYGDLARIIGETVEKAGKTKVFYFDSFEDLKAYLDELKRPDDLLFLKGSQCMGLKGLLEE